MEMKKLSINAGAFVIPNNARVMKDFNRPGFDDTYQYLIKLADLNGVTLCDDDKIIQLWLHSKEVDCDNIADHGFSTEVDGEELLIHSRKIQWVPLKMLDNITEGDIVKLLAPAIGYPAKESVKLGKDGKKLEIILDVSMICQQQGFRYARFGKFEEVLKGIIGGI